MAQGSARYGDRAGRGPVLIGLLAHDGDDGRRGGLLAGLRQRTELVVPPRTRASRWGLRAPHHDDNQVAHADDQHVDDEDDHDQIEHAEHDD